MANRIPIVLGTNVHEPIIAGDLIDPAFLPASAGNAGTGLQGNGTVLTPFIPNFDALPNETLGTFQLVAANGINPDGTKVTLAQLATALTPLLPAEKFLASASYAAPNLTLTLNDASTVVVNLASLLPIVSISGIQGTGVTGNEVKENFDALPAAPATLIAATRFVVAADGTNNDGSIALPADVAAFLRPDVLAETASAFTTTNNVAIPTLYVGSANSMYLATPHRMVRWADAASSTGFYAIPVYEVL